MLCMSQPQSFRLVTLRAAKGFIDDSRCFFFFECEDTCLWNALASFAAATQAGVGGGVWFFLLGYECNVCVMCNIIRSFLATYLDHRWGHAFMWRLRNLFYLLEGNGDATTSKPLGTITPRLKSPRYDIYCKLKKKKNIKKKRDRDSKMKVQLVFI